jgi:predicted HicB family RNase H-like nuclease
MAREKSLEGRKNYGLRLRQELMRELSHLAVDEDRWLNELVEEAIRDLVKKYKEKAKGKADRG